MNFRLRLSEEKEKCCQPYNRDELQSGEHFVLR